MFDIKFFLDKSMKNVVYKFVCKQLYQTVMVEQPQQNVKTAI